MTDGRVKNVDVYLVENGVLKLWNYIPAAEIGRFAFSVADAVTLGKDCELNAVLKRNTTMKYLHVVLALHS